MTDERSERVDHEPWPLRAALLLGAGIACGLLFDLLTRDRSANYDWAWTESVWRISLAVAVAAGFALFAFTLERIRWRWSLTFGAVGGLVIGGIYYWNGTPERHGMDDALRFLASLVSLAIAAPLFQTIRDENGAALSPGQRKGAPILVRRLPYAPVHAHAWTNVVLWCAAWAFVLISWLLANLLGELFDLIGIDLVKEALDESWFVWMLIGGAFGAAVGLLRDRDKVLGLLQRVVTTVLSVLAPVLAAGLVLFVLALPFTGLDVLWEKTRTPTPVMLACVAGAVILANAVIGNSPTEEARGAVLRWSAMALGAVAAPLVAVAAISTALRIGQYGFTPSRLWGVVAVAVAAAGALSYLYALIRGRTKWAERVRPGNIRLAIGVCVVALLLATPLAQFGPISTRSQLARLNSGQVPPLEFDWAAMRFDFGPSGLRALERLKTEGTPEIRQLAQSALRTDNRWDISRWNQAREERRRPLNLRLIPTGGALPETLRTAMLNNATCRDNQACIVFYQPNAATAVLLASTNCADAGGRASSWNRVHCDPRVQIFYADGRAWAEVPVDQDRDRTAEQARARRLDAALRAGRVEIRTVPRRQVYVDGVAVGQPFE